MGETERYSEVERWVPSKVCGEALEVRDYPWTSTGRFYQPELDHFLGEDVGLNGGHEEGKHLDPSD